MNAATRDIALVITTARAGVTYSARHGAVCPCCGAERLPVSRTMPWSGSVRIRYHRCQNPNCLLCAIGEGIKSLQED